MHIELVAIAGPLLGERYVIEKHNTTRIGRSPRGINIADPLVSIEHCELSYHANEGDWTLTDLASQEGTIVNGEKIEKPTAVRPGSIIEIGSTVLLVEAQGGIPKWAVPTFAFVIFAVTGMAAVSYNAMRPVVYEPLLHLGREVHLATGTTSSLVVPTSFIRRQGVDHRSIAVVDVRDDNGDGVDELWLGARDRLLAVSVEADGEWRVFGDFPKGCREVPYVDFPDRLCDGVTHRYAGSAYAPLELEDVVVWMAKKDEKQAAPRRVRMADMAGLRQFLWRRGVKEPVNYLICEDFVAGTPAQVLTESGNVQELHPGCIRELTVSGLDLEVFGGNRPSAAAFTATGYQALQDDLSSWLGGDPDALFADGRGRALRSALLKAPTEHASRLELGFTTLAAEQPPEDFLAAGPIAQERPMQGFRAWSAMDGALEASLAQVVGITREGDAELATAGCSKLRVHTEPWHCSLRHFCRTNTPFLTVTEVGCEGGRQLLTIPYGGGEAFATTGETQVKVIVDAADDGAQIDVLRARLAWRRTPQTH